MGASSERIRQELKRAASTAAAAAATTAQQDAVAGVLLVALTAIGRDQPRALAAFFEAMASPDGEVAGRVKALGTAIGILSDEGRNARLAINPEQLAAAQCGALRVAETAVAFCGRRALIVLREGFSTLNDLLAPAGTWTASQVSPLEPLRREFQSFLTRFDALLGRLKE
jgi:hypothetical protein